MLALLSLSLGIWCWGQNIKLKGLVWACVILLALLGWNVSILLCTGLAKACGSCWVRAVPWGEQRNLSMWKDLYQLRCFWPGQAAGPWSDGVLWLMALRGNSHFLSWKLVCLLALSVVPSTGFFEKAHLVYFKTKERCSVSALLVLGLSDTLWVNSHPAGHRNTSPGWQSHPLPALRSEYLSGFWPGESPGDTPQSLMSLQCPVCLPGVSLPALGQRSWSHVREQPGIQSGILMAAVTCSFLKSRESGPRVPVTSQ